MYVKSRSFGRRFQTTVRFGSSLTGVLSVAALLLFAGCSKSGDEAVDSKPGVFANATVEAACGQCQFGLEGGGCDLAVRIEGAAYYVDGTAIDQHGDAHAEDGFCNAVRTAVVDGQVVDGRFVADSFVLQSAP